MKKPLPTGPFPSLVRLAKIFALLRVVSPRCRVQRLKIALKMNRPESRFPVAPRDGTLASQPGSPQTTGRAKMRRHIAALQGVFNLIHRLGVTAQAAPN